jgi:hypothetical protein
MQKKKGKRDMIQELRKKEKKTDKRILRQTLWSK